MLKTKGGSLVELNRIVEGVVLFLWAVFDKTFLTLSTRIVRSIKFTGTSFQQFSRSDWGMIDVELVHKWIEN